MNKTQFIGQLGSRRTAPFDTPQQALAEAMHTWGHSWGNTNPEHTWRLDYSKEVAPGAWQFQREFLVKMTRPNPNEVPSIASIHDDQGRLVGEKLEFRDVRGAFEKHFNTHGTAGKFD